MEVGPFQVQGRILVPLGTEAHNVLYNLKVLISLISNNFLFYFVFFFFLLIFSLFSSVCHLFSTFVTRDMYIAIGAASQ